VVRAVTKESALLADPSLGNIEMSMDEFAAAYSGYALVISDPSASMQVNDVTDQANIQTNQTNDAINTTAPVDNVTEVNSTSIQPENSKNLSNEEMQNILGKNWKYRKWKKTGHREKSFNWWRIYYYGAHGAQLAALIAPSPVTVLFGALGYVYTNTVGNAHVNEGWWTYT